jgi:hypothetical protein
MPLLPQGWLGAYRDSDRNRLAAVERIVESVIAKMKLSGFQIPLKPGTRSSSFPLLSGSPKIYTVTQKIVCSISYKTAQKLF